MKPPISHPLVNHSWSVSSLNCHWLSEPAGLQASLKDAWNAEEEEGALKSERGGSWVGPAAPLGFKTWAHGNQRHLIDEINVSFYIYVYIYIYICVCVFDCFWLGESKYFQDENWQSYLPFMPVFCLTHPGTQFVPTWAGWPAAAIAVVGTRRPKAAV